MVLLVRINGAEPSLLHYPLPSSLVVGWWLLSLSSRSGGRRVRVLFLGSEVVAFCVLLVLSVSGDDSVSSLGSLISWGFLTVLLVVPCWCIRPHVHVLSQSISVKLLWFGPWALLYPKDKVIYSLRDNPFHGLVSLGVKPFFLCGLCIHTGSPSCRSLPAKFWS